MTRTSATILEVRNLSNHYEGEPLLQDVSFALEEGEILCLLGPSGSGKTTLLRLIAGLEQQESGSIYFKGRDIKDTPPHKRNFGMMFQEYALFPHKDVWQNVSFGLEMQKNSATKRKQRIESILTLVGLAGFEHRRIDELSGGERQRVALARSLAPEPQLLLLDEPLGSLDRTLRDRLTAEIRNVLKELGVTAVFVTHDQAEAFSVADKVAILHQGRMQQLDTPEDLYRRPLNTTVARFLGFSNLIVGEVDIKGVFHSPLGPLQATGTAPKNKPLKTLLIRPESAQIAEGKQKLKSDVHVSGTVVSRLFQGSKYKVKVQAEGIHLSFDLAIEPPPPAPGKPIDLFIRQSAMVLIDD